MTFPLLSLPPEILIIIGSYLPPISLNSLITTNRLFHHLVNNQLWNFIRESPARSYKILADACKNGNLTLVKKLIEDFHIDRVLDDKGTFGSAKEAFLILAANYDRPDVVRYLMSRGGKLAKDRTVSLAMEKAAVKGHDGTVRALMEYYLPEAVLRLGLMKALKNGRDKVLSAVLEGYSPQFSETVDYPLPRIDPNLGPQVWPVIFSAVVLDNPALVMVLLNHGVCRTALSFTARYGKLRAARTLLENGADVSAVDKFGSTPVAAACFTGVPKLLFEFGGSIE